LERVTLNIVGMVCGGCSGTVAKALLAVPGVEAADVSHIEAKAEIRFDPALVGIAQLKAAVEQAGYKVVT
jgi:copper chaperone CopZ